jgi:hypothetical protein
MTINLLISYKYKYQKLCCRPYRNLEYELLKKKNQLYKQPKIKETSNLLNQESNMQMHLLPL